MSRRSHLQATERTVFFDGCCGLCDRAVSFLLRRDRSAALRFGPLQGETARRLRERLPELATEEETMLLVERGPGSVERVRIRSDAALATLSSLRGAWRLVAVLRLVPRPLRDAVYGFVARRRTRWFGRLDACRIATPEERSRFLD